MNNEQIRLTRPSGDYTVSIVERAPSVITFTIDKDSFRYRLDSAVFDSFVERFRAR